MMRTKSRKLALSSINKIRGLELFCIERKVALMEKSGTALVKNMAILAHFFSRGGLAGYCVLSQAWLQTNPAQTDDRFGRDEQAATAGPRLD
jgi:hypothetical protein